MPHSRSATMGVKIRERRGAWWLFIDWHGRRKAKRVGVGTEGKKAAKAAAEQIQARLVLGDFGVFAEPKPSVPTFREVYEEWARHYPALNAVRESTMRGYRSFAEHHLLPGFGDRPITAITTETVEEFIEWKRAPGGSLRRGKALADSSLRTGLFSLRLILKRAVRRGLIASSPMADLDWHRAPTPDHVDPFTTRELGDILDAATRLEPDVATMLRVWIQSGMRAGEVAGLQWQDVDMETGLVQVRRTWSHGRLGPTKTATSTREVSILHPIAEVTDEWRPTDRLVLRGLQNLSVRALTPEAFVFGPPRSSAAMNRSWRRILTAAKVRYREPEQCRHSFASTMLSRNAPLLYVQRQGGWRSAGVLLRVYARWMPQPSATPAQPVSRDMRIGGETGLR